MTQHEIENPATGTPLVSIDSPILKDVRVSLDAKLGQADLSIEELLGLKSGSVLTLDLQLNDPIDLHLNGVVVARGEIVAVDDHFGVRIIEVSQAL